MKLVWALLFSAAFGTCRAAEQQQECSASTFAAVGAHFKIADFKLSGPEGGVVLAAACKTLPSDPKMEIAVFAYDAGKPDEKQQLTTILDQASGKVVSALAATIMEDAMMSVYGAHFRIDTARYQLAPGVRAFGVDLGSGYNHHYCPEGGWGPVRTLYVREGARLRPVLDGMVMSTWHYVDGTFQGCAEQPEGTPGPVTETTELSLALMKSTSHGYADLALTASTSDDRPKPGKRVKRSVLRYDGKAYPADIEVHQ